MNIFQVKTQPGGIERREMFLSEGFVCIGYADTGDLSNCTRDDIREKLNKAYGYESSQLGNHLGVVNAFVNTMAEGDIVLIAVNDWVHVGKVGDYKYEPQYANNDMCHRRYVNWLAKAEKYKFNEQVKELLRNRSIVTQFKHPADIAELDKVLDNKASKISGRKEDSAIIDKAVAVLVKALDSENEETRTEAAKALLNYLK